MSEHRGYWGKVAQAVRASIACCARCGHAARGCPRCGRDTILGGTIDGRRYCHTEAEQPSCYTLTLREETR